MTARMSASRRNAFLKALGETGNFTISAERAKVSRSWVLLHRKRDAGFDAECREAVEKARQSFDRLRTSGGKQPPHGWGFLDGEELVVRGSGGSGGGRRVQIARARLHQWTPRIEDRFLATLAATCNVSAAMAEVGMSKGSTYSHRRRWPGFARRWDEAVKEGYARIEIALVENGCNLFSSPELPPAMKITGMTADHAIHLLHMHKREAKGIGGAPGVRWRPPPTLDDPVIRRGILRKIEAVKNARNIGEEDRARDRAEWALRRGSGQAPRRGSGRAPRRGSRQGD